jgi:hypothetical protein
MRLFPTVGPSPVRARAERRASPRCPRVRDDEVGGGTEEIEFLSLGFASTVAVPRDEVRRDPERWMNQWLVLMRDLDERMECAREAGSHSFPPELLPVADLSLGCSSFG